jgi:hypothetical protein
MQLVHGADNLAADCLGNVGSLTSHNPISLQGLLRDSFALLAMRNNGKSKMS